VDTPERDSSDKPERRHLEGQAGLARLREVEQKSRGERHRPAGDDEAVSLRPDRRDVNADAWENLEIVRGQERVGKVSMEHLPSLGKAPAETHLHEIRVDEAHRGKGYGSRALREAEDAARRRGSRAIHGEVSAVDLPAHDEGNVAAKERTLGFYRKNGYEVEDTGQPVVFGRFRKPL
jgi:GNAT superfamily N-acetyltransferase